MAGTKAAHHRSTMRMLLGLGLLAVLALRAAPGSACIRETTWSAVDTATPSAASVDVPLDAPILVRFTSSTYTAAMSGSTPAGYSVPAAILTTSADAVRLPLHELQLARDDGLPPHGLGPLLTAYVPDAPLLPNTQYTVQVGEAVELPNPSVNPPTTWSFTTGAGPRPPLYFEGPLGVSFEPGLDPHMVCQIPLQSLCGGSPCTQMGNDAVTKARIVLPAVLGGYSEEFLSGKITVRDESDPNASEKFLFTGVMPNAGRASELLLTLPLDDAGQSYVPCLTITVSDARGDESSVAWCAETAFPLPAENHETPQLSSGRHTSTACSVALVTEGSAGGYGGSVAALTGLLAASRLRSRRRRSAL